MQTIWLIGFMGAGKTTVGQLLAERLGYQHTDFDYKIEAVANMTIESYFEKYGEAAFRQFEHETLRDFKETEYVVSTGGGIVLKPENRAVLKALSPVIYLKTAPEVFLKRLKTDERTVRPVVAKRSDEEIAAIFAARAAFYEECATFVVETNERTPAEIVADILAQLEMREGEGQ